MIEEESTENFTNEFVEENITNEPSLSEQVTTLNDTEEEIENLNSFSESIQERDSPPPSKLRFVSWELDEERQHCAQCFLVFTLVLRRHHCRVCGKIFCSKCTRHWIHLPEYGYQDPERTCHECWKTQTVDFSRNYDMAGPSDGRETLVLIHPALFSRTFWTNQMKEWSKRFRVIAIDLPGHGTLEEMSLTFDTAVDSIAKLIQELVPSKKAIVLGHSFGGFMSLMFASRYPDLCSGLILSSSCGENASLGTKITNAIYSGVYSTCPQNLLWTLVFASHSEIPKPIIRETIFKLGVNFETWPQIAALEVPSPTFIMDTLTSFKKPVLIINGEKETRKLETAFVSVGENVKLHVIKGAGSMAPLQPNFSEEYNEVVTNFVEELSV